jgi:hypothetical protein
MVKTSTAHFPRLRVMAPVLISVALAATGCQGEDSKNRNSASPSAEKWSCEKILGPQGEVAVRRVADIPNSVKIRFSGHPEDTAGDFVAKYDAGVADEAEDLDFCRIYRESAEVLPSVEVRFSLVQEIPESSDDSIGAEYRMGKVARATTKKGVLYFECSSAKFSLGAGATVLVRGESRTIDEVTESENAAQEDNLRIVYASSRAFSELLGCKSNAGLPDSFTMPPQA